MSKDVIFRTSPSGFVYPIEVAVPSKKTSLPYTTSNTYPTTCPCCSKSVYFYKNDNGSRVFFNSVGWPWPKHLCKGMSEFVKQEKRSLAKQRKKARRKKSMSSDAKLAKHQEKLKKEERKKVQRAQTTIFNEAQVQRDRQREESRKRYLANPGFRLKNIERSLLTKIDTYWYLFRPSEIYTDYRRRKGVKVAYGYILKPTPELRKTLNENWNGMPAYVEECGLDSVELSTHLPFEERYRLFTFKSDILKTVEIPLDDLDPDSQEFLAGLSSDDHNLGYS